MVKMSSDDSELEWHKEVRKLAVFMHEEYEKIARDEDWQTQERTQVPFEELPRENLETMLILAKRVYEYVQETKKK